MYLDVQGGVAELGFIDEALVALLENGVIVKAKIEYLRNCLRNRGEKSQASEVMIVAGERFEVIALLNFHKTCIFDNLLYCLQLNSITSLNLSTLPSELILQTISLKQHTNADFCADRQLSLLQNESITCSHIVIEHAWPLYVVGTSLGRIFIVPLSSRYSTNCLQSAVNRAKISCLVFTQGMLVSCFQDGNVEVWSMSDVDLIDADTEVTRTQSNTIISESRKVRSSSISDTPPSSVPTHNRLIRSFHIPYRPVVAIVLPNLMNETETPLNQASWTSTWEDWKQIIIGQLEDGLVIIVSIKNEEVVSVLYGVKGLITKARVDMPLEYLLLETQDEVIYVFNTMSQALERIINSAPVFSHAVRKDGLLSKDPETPRTYPEKLLETSLATCHSPPTSEPMWTECKFLGKTPFPILCLSIEQLITSILASSRVTELTQFAISLLNCWKLPKTMMEREVQTELRLFYDVRKLTIAPNIGVFGDEDSVSFPFPREELLPWELSPYVSAIASLSLITVLSTCISFRADSKVAVKRCEEFQALGLRHIYPCFQPQLVSLLGFKAVSGNQSAFYLLRLIIPVCASEEFAEYWLTFLSQDGETKKEIDHKFLTAGKAIAILVLGVLSVKETYSALPLPDLVHHLYDLLDTQDPGFITAAALVISEGIKTWLPQVEKKLIASVTSLLLVAHRTLSPMSKSAVLKALIFIGKCDVQGFCEVLKREVIKIELGAEWPQNVLMVLEAFVKKQHQAMLFCLASVMEVIILSLDLKDIYLRKACIPCATRILEQLVTRFPMVSFDPANQRLAVGTHNRTILLYNLSAGILWETVEAHEGPVTALAFNTEGSILASYSIYQAQLQFWNIKKRFFGLRKDTIEKGKTIKLSSVKPETKSTKELLETVKLRWSQSQVRLTRENKVRYTFE